MKIPDKFLDLQFYLNYDKKARSDIVFINIPESYLGEIYTSFRYYCSGCDVQMLVSSKIFGSTINELAKSKVNEEYCCDACGFKVIFEFRVGNENLGKHLSFDNNPLNMHD